MRSIAALTLLCALGAAPLAAAEPAVAGWHAKVVPAVLERAAAGGRVDVLLALERRADLAKAATIPDRVERVRFVVERLQRVARESQAPVLELLGARGVEHRSFWVANLIRARVDQDDLAAVAGLDAVARVVSNPTVTARIPDAADAPPGGDASRAIEWNVSHVGADQVWDLGITGAGVVIGAQDTGYDWDHPAVRDAYLGWDGQTVTHDYHWHDAIHAGGGSCGADSPEPCDDHGHGTHTLGTMVGDDGGTNRIGLAPGARWIGCRNMDVGDGTPASYTECFEWFLAPTDSLGANPDPAQAPHVINNSWSCPVSEGCDGDTLRDVVDNVRAAGIVVVVSAGNNGGLCGSVDEPPAIHDASFSVGAIDATDVIAGFSSRGPVTVDGSGRMKPDIVAPGVSVRSSWVGGGYLTAQGTSMAGPHVAAAVALLLDARPDLAGRVDEIEDLLRASSVPLTTTQGCGGDAVNAVPNNTFGAGRLDVLGLIEGDADGDGAGLLDDCEPLDPEVWAVPGPVTGLRLERIEGAVRLAWDPPQAPGSGAPSYRILRSPEPTFAAADCAVDGWVATQWDDEVALPAPGAVEFMTVRPVDACATAAGTAGTCP